MTDFTPTPLKYLSTARITSGVGLPAEHDEPSWPRYIRTTDIAGPTRLRDDVFYSQPPELLRNAAVERGDLLLTNAGTIGKSYLHREEEPAVYAGYLTRVRPDPGKCDSRFLAYFAQSQPYWDQINVGATRSTIDNFSSGKYQDLIVPLPPLDVQRRIADYLDTETARIETLITKNIQAAALVEERLAAAVDDAISQGGGVPLGYVADVSVSNVDKHTVENDPTVRLCNYVDVYQRQRITGDLAFMNSTATRDQLSRFRLQPGDVVITKDSETADDIGVPALVECDEPDLVLGYHCGLLRPRTGLDGSYLYWVMRRRKTAVYWEVRASGVTRVGLRRDDIRSLPVPMPELTDQRRIAATLWRQQDAADTLLARLDDQRDMVSERRQALITAAVTGEIEV